MSYQMIIYTGMCIKVGSKEEDLSVTVVYLNYLGALNVVGFYHKYSKVYKINKYTHLYMYVNK